MNEAYSSGMRDGTPLAFIKVLTPIIIRAVKEATEARGTNLPALFFEMKGFSMRL